MELVLVMVREGGVEAEALLMAMMMMVEVHLGKEEEEKEKEEEVFEQPQLGLCLVAALCKSQYVEQHFHLL